MPLPIVSERKIQAFRTRFHATPKMTLFAVKRHIQQIMFPLLQEDKDIAYKKMAFFLHPDRPLNFYSIEEKTHFFQILEACKTNVINDNIPNELHPVDESLIQAVRDRNLNAVRTALAADANPDFSPACGLTALFWAVCNQDINIIRLLIAAGADINQKVLLRAATVLHCVGNNVVVASLLINAGVNINAVDIEGNTALDCAIKYKHKEMIALLAPITPKRWSFYKTVLLPTVIFCGLGLWFLPLWGAFLPGVLTVVLGSVFVKIKNSAIGARPVFVETPELSRVDSEEPISLLQQQLYEAVYKGELEAVKAVIVLGADVEAKTIDGKSMLCVAAEKGYLEIIETLISSGADINAQSMNNMTPLHWACLVVNENIIAVRALISRGTNVNLRSVSGQTPLHYAVYYADYELMELLLKSGIDVNIKDNKGQTALDMAHARRAKRAIQLLTPHTPKRWLTPYYSVASGVIAGFGSMFMLASLSALGVGVLGVAAGGVLFSKLNQRIDKMSVIVGKSVLPRVGTVPEKENATLLLSRGIQGEQPVGDSQLCMRPVSPERNSANFG